MRNAHVLRELSAYIGEIWESRPERTNSSWLTFLYTNIANKKITSLDRRGDGI